MASIHVKVQVGGGYRPLWWGGGEGGEKLKVEEMKICERRGGSHSHGQVGFSTWYLACGFSGILKFILHF
jgi:hypothetical protein